MDQEDQDRGRALTRRRRWTPQPGPQSDLFDCPVRKILYGGARGGGKTDGLIGHWLRHQKTYGKRARGIVFRVEYAQTTALVERIKELAPKAAWSSAGGLQRFRWPSGATLAIRHCKTLEDVGKTQGWSVNWFGFEELGELDNPEVYDRLTAIVRDANGVPCFELATANPGGVGHAWIKAEWIEGRPPMTPFTSVHRRTGEPVRDASGALKQQVFIPARVWDNKRLLQSDPAYLARLQNLPEHMRRAWLAGDWDVAAGGYLAGVWDPARHVVPPFLPPADWPRWRAMDWGYARPFSIGWYAMRPRDHWIVRYREFYGSSGSPNEGLRLDPQIVAAKMRLMETHERERGLRFFRNPADPSIWGEHGHETSVGMLFQREGFRWIKAAAGPGSRVSGAHVILWLLAQDRLAVTGDCADFLRTVPVLPVDPNRIEDVDTHAEDHAWDELRYAVTARVTLSKQDLARSAAAKHGRRRPVLVEDLLAGRGPPGVDLYELLRRR